MRKRIRAGLRLPAAGIAAAFALAAAGSPATAQPADYDYADFPAYGFGFHVPHNTAIDVGPYDDLRNQQPIGFSNIFGPSSTMDAVANYIWMHTDGYIVDGSDPASFGPQAVQVRTFCVEAGVPFIGTVSGGADEYGRLLNVDYADLREGDPARIPHAAWVAMNSTVYVDDGNGVPVPSNDNPVGDPAVFNGYTVADANNAEGSAAQLAIWVLVNGEDITATVNPHILARAQELVDLAEQAELDGELPDEPTMGDLPVLTIDDVTYDTGYDTMVRAALGLTDEDDDAVQAMKDTKAVLRVRVGDTGGGVAGVTVSLSSDLDLDIATDGVQTNVTVVTSAIGEALVVVERDEDQTLGVTGSAGITMLLPAGLLMQPDDTASGMAQQQVITADPVESVVPIQADVEVEARPDRSVPTSTTTTTVDDNTPSSTTTEDPGGTTTRLPHTGGNVTLMMVAAFALAGTTGAVLLTRRTNQL